MEYDRRYEQYSLLREAVKEKGMEFEEFLLNFVKKAKLQTGLYVRRKGEIVERLAELIPQKGKPRDFSGVLEGIFHPSRSNNSVYACDCALMHICEVILDVEEDLH